MTFQVLRNSRSLLIYKIQEIQGGDNIISLQMSRNIEKRKSRPSTFLTTLRQILNNQSQQYISWSEQGASFTIKNPSRFTEDILPKYFKHSNLSSFVRQLNIYDFKKTANEKYPDSYIYLHPYFDRNKPQLMISIHRKTNRNELREQRNQCSQDIFQNISNVNSNTQSKKKILDEIDLLQKQLSSLRSFNTHICQENLMLERQIPQIKMSHSDLYMFFVQILKQSYYFQVLNYEKMIHLHLRQQSCVMNQISQNIYNQVQKAAAQLNLGMKQDGQKMNFEQKCKNSSTNCSSSSFVNQRVYKLKREEEKGQKRDFLGENKIQKVKYHYNYIKKQKRGIQELALNNQKKQEMYFNNLENLKEQRKKNLPKKQFKIFQSDHKEGLFASQADALKQSELNDSQNSKNKDGHQVCIVNLNKKYKRLENTSDDYTNKNQAPTMGKGNYRQNFQKEKFDEELII